MAFILLEWWVRIELTDNGFAIHPLNHSGTTTYCGADWTRTSDFLRAREAFSQLNYSPIN
jgi:hypothetical protein